MTKLHTAEAAQALLERQYLDGHPALFSNVIEDVARLRESAEGLVGLGDALRPLIEGGSRSSVRRSRTLTIARLGAEARKQAPALAARLVDEARLATLDVLGDGAAASSIAARRFRSGTDVPAERQPDRG